MISTVPERLIRDGDRFSGSNLYIRLLTIGDCTERYVSWLNDPHTNRFLETRRAVQSLDDVKAFVRSARATPTAYHFGIFNQASDEHIGNIKIGPIDLYHRFGYLGYLIGDRAHWGKGYATEAVVIAIGVAFEGLHLRRLLAGTYALNVGSVRVLEKTGFSLEGRASEMLLVGAGRYDDRLAFGLLIDSWRNQPASRNGGRKGMQME